MVDFHTLRSTAISWWLDVDKLSPKRVQTLARLATLTLVYKYSRKWRIGDHEWLDKGPTLVEPPPPGRPGKEEKDERKPEDEEVPEDEHDPDGEGRGEGRD